MTSTHVWRRLTVFFLGLSLLSNAVSSTSDLEQNVLVRLLRLTAPPLFTVSLVVWLVLRARASRTRSRSSA